MGIMAPDATEDLVAYPQMIRLLACFEEEVAKRKLPGFCFIGLLPGSEAAEEHCGNCDTGGCGGMAWVMLSTQYASSVSPPAPDTTVTGCTPGMLTQLTLATRRCMPMGDDNGNPPTVDELLATTRLQMADMAAMRAAILCCFAKDENIAVQLGTYVPSLPSGGCVGGGWTVNFW